MSVVVGSVHACDVFEVEIGFDVVDVVDVDEWLQMLSAAYWFTIIIVSGSDVCEDASRMHGLMGWYVCMFVMSCVCVSVVGVCVGGCTVIVAKVEEYT